jgi:mono/diheme cytochrome c family protein
MRGLSILLVLASTLGACGKNSEPPPPSSGTFGAKPESGPRNTAPTATGDLPPGVEARETFTQVCSQCHGLDGTGTGPASEMLDPKPRNYTDPKWQASVSDDDIEKIILLGGQAVGKSASMPAQPQLKTRPEVVHDLVKIIRGFAKK